MTVPSDGPVVVLFVSSTRQQKYYRSRSTYLNNYYFRYTGGTDGKGNVTAKVGTAETIHIELATDPAPSDPPFKIVSVEIYNDPHDQLGSRVNPDKNTAQVSDAATATESDAYYQVKVGIGDTTETFDCDPRVSNEDED